MTSTASDAVSVARATGEALRLPEFFVLGPQKTATTWLYECLSTHPDVAVPRRVKETFFFDRYYARGPRWYAAYFEDAKPSAKIGEIAPTYFGSDLVPARIAALGLEPKFIVILRNPIERAWSMYLHYLRKGDTAVSFERAIEDLPDILDHGLYARHLGRYFEYFPPNSFLLLDHARIAENSQEALQSVQQFLGVNEFHRPERMGQKSNVSTMPGYRHLTKYLIRGSRLLHKYGLHEVVAAGKKLGLRKIAFREQPFEQAQLSFETTARLRQHFLADWDDLDALYPGQFTAAWRAGAG